MAIGFENGADSPEQIQACLHCKRLICNNCMEKKYVKKTPRLKAVWQINEKTGRIIDCFKTIKEAEQKTGVRRSYIYKCAQGFQKSAGGYRWEIEREEKR